MENLTSYEEIKKAVTLKRIIRFTKFCMVGGSGVAVNMGVLWLLTEIAGLYYLISSLLAISLAMINNFIWNDLWTWNDRGLSGIKAYFIRLVKFCLVSSIAGFVGNFSILWTLTHFFNINYLISNFIGILIGTLLNFYLNNMWTYKRK